MYFSYLFFNAAKQWNRLEEMRSFRRMQLFFLRTLFFPLYFFSRFYSYFMIQYSSRLSSRAGPDLAESGVNSYQVRIEPGTGHQQSSELTTELRSSAGVQRSSVGVQRSSADIGFNNIFSALGLWYIFTLYTTGTFKSVFLFYISLLKTPPLYFQEAVPKNF